MNDDVDPIIVADGGVCCEHCGTAFDPDDVASTAIPSATLLRCPECGRWTEENDGCEVSIATNSEAGANIYSEAILRGEDPDEIVREAVKEFTAD